LKTGYPYNDKVNTMMGERFYALHFCYHGANFLSLITSLVNKRDEIKEGRY